MQESCLLLGNFAFFFAYGIAVSVSVHLDIFARCYCNSHICVLSGILAVLFKILWVVSEELSTEDEATSVSPSAVLPPSVASPQPAKQIVSDRAISNNVFFIMISHFTLFDPMYVISFLQSDPM